MLKLLGSLCVLSGGGLVWRSCLAERRRQRETLCDLLMALRRMAEEIRMARTPLPSLLDALAKSCGPEGADFFHQAAETARKGGDLPAAWHHAAGDLPLEPGDREALAALGDSLHGDEESVCKAISLVIYQLAKSLEETDRVRQQEEKRTAALCFSAAALLVILLI